LANILEKTKLHILCPKHFFISSRAFETIKQKMGEHVRNVHYAHTS